MKGNPVSGRNRQDARWRQPEPDRRCKSGKSPPINAPSIKKNDTGRTCVARRVYLF